MRVVGVIPGGGSGERMAPLPSSKELLPLGFRATPRGPRPKVIANYLIDAMREAGVDQVFWLIDRSKTDILQYFGSGAEVGVQLAYVPTEASPSIVHTLDNARGFLGDAQVLFGFPDIVFEPVHALRALRQRLSQGRADVVLAALPSPPEQIADRVVVDATGRALSVLVKPFDGSGSDAWVLAAWAPSFTRFLERWLLARASLASATLQAASAEPYLGHVLQAAIVAGLSIEVETFQLGSFIDVGTSQGFASAVRRYGEVGLAPDAQGAPAASGAEHPTLSSHSEGRSR
ncbi:MAG: dTDP-glucose pyrophosphorylase [Deltaproteobacteria bacterium]